MSHSVCAVFLHIVFCTKDRQPWLLPINENDIHSYIAGIIKNLKGKPVLINGTEDHVHILCTIPSDTSVSYFVRDIKANSSGWIRQKYNPLFHWQEGYGAYSVGLSNLEQVRGYISNQKEHHQQQSTEEESDAFMKAWGIEPFRKQG